MNEAIAAKTIIVLGAFPVIVRAIFTGMRSEGYFFRDPHIQRVKVSRCSALPRSMVS